MTIFSELRYQTKIGGDARIANPAYVLNHRLCDSLSPKLTTQNPSSHDSTLKSKVGSFQANWALDGAYSQIAQEWRGATGQHIVTKNLRPSSIFF